jgi:hypothetical protein
VTEVAGLFAYLGILQISQASDKPAFVLNPQSAVAPTGTSVSLTAWAVSSFPISYQWYFTNGPIAGATSTNLLIPSLSVSNVGAYFVVATNVQGAATSLVATVAIGPDHLPASSILIDLGRHDGGANGDITTSPDVNGNYWNNIGPSGGTVALNTAITNLVAINNSPTTYGLTVVTSAFLDNGNQNGGLTTPDQLLLGDFAVATATEDYFFVQGTAATGTLKLAGLDPATKYNLGMFASRTTDASTTRTTRYSVNDVNGLHVIDLQTSGPGSGSPARPYGNDDTVAYLNNLIPNASGQLDLAVTVVDGDFAYLAVLQVVPTSVSTFLPPTATAGGWRLQIHGTPGYIYHVQRALDVIGPWTDLGVVVAPGSGFATFDDTNAPSTQAFYRTVVP